MMIDTVLFVGDPHFKGDNIEQTTRYASECIEALSRLVSMKGSQRCMCVVAGDVLDGHGVVQLQCMVRAVDFLKRLKDIAFTAVLVGNHDYFNNAQYLSDMHWMVALKGWNEKSFVVCDRPTVVDDIVLAPYVPTGRLMESLDQCLDKDWRRDTRAVFAHQELKGVRLAANVVSSKGDYWDPTLPHMISGHIHGRQRLAPNVWYPGSVIQHAFGDRGESCVSIINIPEIPDRNQPLKFIDVPINVPTKRYVEVNCEDIINKIASRFDFVPRELEKLKLKLIFNCSSQKNHPDVKRYVRSVPSHIDVVYRFDHRKRHREDGRLVHVISRDDTNFKTMMEESVRRHPNDTVKELYETVLEPNTATTVETNNPPL